MTLAGARLRNSPARDEVPQVLKTWLRVFESTPGPVLQQAADDYVTDHEFWPTPAEFRKIITRIESHHGGSIYGDPSRLRTPLKGVARVTRGGWTAVYAEELAPQPVAALADIEPPPHPDFASWTDAQAWQEDQIHARGETCRHEIEPAAGIPVSFQVRV